jgi:hypothetical protein
LGDVRQALEERLDPEQLSRVRVLMDHRANRHEYERLVAESNEHTDEK